MNNYPQRHSFRLRSYDYTWQGAYFITICTHNRQILLGKVVDSSMILNLFGELVESCWKEIPLHYPEADNSVFIVMPNHIHGIIIIRDLKRAGSKPAPTTKHSLSEIIRGFKTYSSTKINKKRKTRGIPVWQRGYYEHIIRSESEYHEIGEYILFNPAKWETDHENPNFRPDNTSPPFKF